MKVLLTLDAVGGIWRYAMDLGAGLRAAGCEVVLAGSGPRPDAAQAAEAARVGRLAWGGVPLDWMVRDPAALAGVGPWLSRLARAERPDVIQVNLPTQAAGLHADAPVVAVCHSCLATWFRAVEGGSVPPGLAWHARLMRRGLARAAAVVAPSAAQARATDAEYGLAEVAVVPNAARAPVRPAGGGRGVVALARWWDRGKNGAVLVAAAPRAGWPVTMIGATEGPDGQRLEVGPLSAPTVLAPGVLAHAAALERVAQAGLFVSPSVYEPFGLAALEAARLGRPLVLADIPTYREVWSGAGVFFAPHDAAGLAALLAHLAGDPAERLRLGVAAQARARTLTPERQARAMLSIYRRAAAAAAVA